VGVLAKLELDISVRHSMICTNVERECGSICQHFCIKSEKIVGQVLGIGSDSLLTATPYVIASGSISL